jgi:hypothetical protein
VPANTDNHEFSHFESNFTTRCVAKDPPVP